MNVELTWQEIGYLQRVLNYELHKVITLQNHAIAHGTEVDISDGGTAEQLLAKLDGFGEGQSGLESASM